MSNDNWYEQRREADFNDQAQREADATYYQEKGWESIKAQEETDRTAAYVELLNKSHGYGPTPPKSGVGRSSYRGRNVRRRVENPRWLGIVLFLVIFAIEILSLHVTTVSGYGWNSGGGVIALGLLAWLATFLILKAVLLFGSIGKRGRH